MQTGGRTFKSKNFPTKRTESITAERYKITQIFKKKETTSILPCSIKGS